MRQFRDLAAGSANELADVVENLIRRGTLESGDRLPPIREAAAMVGLSPNTVASAYRTLSGRGLIVGRGRAGSFVAEHRAPMAEPPVADGLIDLATGNPDPALLPEIGPHLAAIDPTHVLYGGSSVNPWLGEVAAQVLRDHGLPDGDLAIVNGAIDGVERALLAHLRPGDRVALEAPGWPAFSHLIAAIGLVPVTVEVDEYGIIPERLEAVADRVDAVVCTPRVHNPTGAAFSEERARDLREVLSSRERVLVVEDDHAGLIADVPLHAIGPGRPRWAFVQSVSKSLGPDLRLAYMTGDAGTISRVVARQSVGVGWVSHVLQRLTASVLSDPKTSEVLKLAGVEYRRRRTLLVGALNDAGMPSVGCSGINVWVPSPRARTLVVAAEHSGFAIRSGEQFEMGTAPGVRISIGFLGSNTVPSLVDALADPDAGRSGRWG